MWYEASVESTSDFHVKSYRRDKVCHYYLGSERRYDVSDDDSGCGGGVYYVGVTLLAATAKIN